jgi:ABC-type bacteriocin/lantibiotic exporter with double-glycine peptidase domain
MIFVSTYSIFMTLKTFFAQPVVIFGVHVLLVTGVMLNIFQFYRQYTIQKDYEKQKSVLAFLTQEIKDAETQKDYTSSQLYKEKFAKESGYKVKGETVIDTSKIEAANSVSSTPSQYKPSVTIQEKKNWEKWWEMFFLPESVGKN